MYIKRANRDKRLEKYCHTDSFIRNLSYACIDEENNLIAIADFFIINQYEAKFISYQLLDKFVDINNLLKMFIEEFLYWNPFTKSLYYQEEVIINYHAVEIFKLPILDIQVEQLTVSKPKLDDVLKWVEKEEDVIICVIKIDNQFVCIDGYSRLLAAYLKGFKNVYCYLEKEDYDENDFREFLNWCHMENIFTVKDLVNRVVSEDEHQKIWIDKCQNYFKKKKGDSMNNELMEIINKFALSGWNLIEVPAKAWLKGEISKNELIVVIKQADIECGNCGCEFDPLYKRAIELLESN